MVVLFSEKKNARGREAAGCLLARIVSSTGGWGGVQGRGSAGYSSSRDSLGRWMWYWAEVPKGTKPREEKKDHSPGACRIRYQQQEHGWETAYERPLLWYPINHSEVPMSIIPSPSTQNLVPERQKELKFPFFFLYCSLLQPPLPSIRKHFKK